MSSESRQNESLPDTIRWRIHLSSPPQQVFNTLASAEGRRRFWAEQAPESDGFIHFTFSNGAELKSRILEKRSAERFVIEYFGGSRVSFDLAESDSGGTDLTMTERDVPETNRLENLPGWISVLLAFKAAVDFSIDLRNHDPKRTWDQGYVDV